MSEKLLYHLLPISLSARVLEWSGVWSGSRVASVESGGDGVSCVPMVVLSVVAAILGAVGGYPRLIASAMRVGGGV